MNSYTERRENGIHTHCKMNSMCNLTYVWPSPWALQDKRTKRKLGVKAGVWSTGY